MTWQDIFDDEIIRQLNDNATAAVIDAVGSGKRVFPPTSVESGKITKTQMFRALDLTPLDEVRVVILGQDPYHEENQANGLAFSVYNGVKMPPSLRNMFKELQDDLGGELRLDTDLSDWARQGVLLLNTALTVIEGSANSMAKVWEPFTDRLIELIDQSCSPVIFVLWGSNAQKKEKLIKNNRDYIVKSAHPSPLSAYRGFFGSRPYSKINQMLKDMGQKEIIWNNINR